MPTGRDRSNGRFVSGASGQPAPESLTATRTGPQDGGMAWWGGAHPFVVGGDPAAGGPNPCGFPGYGGAYAGTYSVYRQILMHPTVRFARAVVTSPVLSNVWSVEPTREDLPPDAERWQRHAEACVLPLRRRIVRMGLHALDMGWSGAEVVWSVRDGLYVPDVKWLANDMTDVVTDKGGNVVGLSQPGATGDAGYGVNRERVPGLGAYKYLRLVNDELPGELYGRSRLENVRAYAWRPWLDAMQQLAKLQKKISGVVGLLRAPAGKFRDDVTGAEVRFSEVAVAAATAMTNCGFGVLPTIALSGRDKNGQISAETAAALSKISLYGVDWYDAGSHAPAIGGYLDLLRYYDGLIFNGWLRSARTGLESEHGSRADAESHGDTGVLDAEAVDDDIAEQATRLVDDVLVLNYGERARGTFRLVAPPLVSQQMTNLRTFMGQIMAQPAVALAMARATNIPDLMRHLDVPHDPEAGDPRDLIEADPAEADDAADDDDDDDLNVEYPDDGE